MARNGRSDRERWLRSVLDRYERPLIRYATRLTGDTERARDVVQDVFIRLCTEDRGPIQDHVAEWLFTVCRNRARDVRRKEKRMRRLDDATAESKAGADPSPPAVLESREASSQVLRLLAALPDSQQEAVWLKFQSGLSYKEIAGVLNTSVSNVGVLIHTAIKTLREALRSDAQ